MLANEDKRHMHERITEGVCLSCYDFGEYQQLTVDLDMNLLTI